VLEWQLVTLRRLFFLLFGLSGFSALVYEVVWARILTLFLGNTVYAVSVILTIFFAGLAFGSFFFGRIIDRIKKPLLTYGILELGIGLYGFLTAFIFYKLIPIQVFLSERWFGKYPWFLAFAVLILPTVLMGGTLPVLARFLTRQEKESGEVIGNLYGLNTTGAFLGAFLTGFFLIPYLGVQETIWVVAAFNLAIGLVVLLIAQKGVTIKPVEQLSLKPKRDLAVATGHIDSKTAAIILFIAGLNGFAALALEVLWTRVLILTFGSSTYAFTTILAVFLLGIALGSLLASKFLVGRQNSLLWLLTLEFALGGLVIFVTPLLGELPLWSLSFYKGQVTFFTNLWAAFLLSFAVIFLPTVLMGATFPLLAKVLTGDFKKIGRDLGTMYGVNTAGGILGSFVAGFFLISLFGIQKGILLSAFCYFLAGVAVLTLLPWGRVVKAGTILFLIILSGSAFLLPSWNKHILASEAFLSFKDYLGAGSPKMEMEKGRLLFYKEGLSATVAIKEKKDNIYMRINGKTDASTDINGDLNTELLAGHLPTLFHRDPKIALVIGLGSGISLGAVEQYGSIEEVDLVEIELAVIEGAQFFAKANNNALEDPRLKTIAGDGRNFLLSTSKKYDVICSEPSNPWFKGNANLFTKEYYQLARERLKDDGIFLHWVQLYYLDKESFKIALATFRAVFPDMTVWSSVFADDLLLVGTKGQVKLDFELLEKKFQEEKVKKDLARIGLREPAQVLGLFLTDSEGIKNIVNASTILHTDNHPVLEFFAPFSLGKETTGENLEVLLSIQKEPYSLFANLPVSEKKRTEANLALKENIFRGKIALTKGNFEEALSFFLKAQELDPKRKQTKSELATIYFYQAEDFFVRNDYLKAKEALLKVVEAEPSHTLAHLNLGSIYFQEGDVVNAFKEWKMAEQQEPDNPEVKRNLELLKGLRE